MPPSYKIAAFILFIVISPGGQGQERALVDSLNKALLHATNDTVKANIYNTLSWEFRGERLDLAYDYGERALAIYRQQNNISRECEVLNKLGVINRNRAEYIEALGNYFEVLQIANSTTYNNQIAYAFNNIGDIYNRLGKYDEAFEFIEKAYPLFISENDQPGLAYNFTQKGIILDNKGQHEQAEKWFLNSLTIRIKLGNKRGIATSMQYLGDNCLNLNQLKDALGYYTRSLAIVIENGYEPGFAYVGLGRYYLRIKDYNIAIKYFNLAINTVKKINNPVVLVNACDGLNEAYLALNDHKNAIRVQLLAKKEKEKLREISEFEKIAGLYYNYYLASQKMQNEFNKANLTKEYNSVPSGC